MFASASIWGLYWLPLRYLEEHGIAGGWAIAAVNLPAGLVLVPVVLSRWRANTRFFLHAVAIGVLTGSALSLYASGLIYSSVVRATLLFYLTPVWATLIGIAWLGEKSSIARWTAISAGLVGLGMLVSGGGSVPLNIGDFFALLSGVFWALGAAMIVRFDKVPVPAMTMIQFAVTALGALAIGALMGAASLPAATDLIAIMPLSSAISILIFLPCVVVIFWTQKFLFPGRAGLLMMSEVLMAVLSASLLIPEEKLSAIEWGGAVLIIGACLFEVLVTSQQDPAALRRA